MSPARRVVARQLDLVCPPILARHPLVVGYAGVVPDARAAQYSLPSSSSPWESRYP